MRGKKASLDMAFNVGQMIIRIIALTFITLVVVMFIRHFILVDLEVKDVEANVLVNRLIFSPNCIAYENLDFGRVYPGIVDITRFNSAVLEECVYYGERNDFIAANLTLSYLDAAETQYTYLNKEGYILLQPRTNFKGEGGANYYAFERYVLVQDEENQRGAILTIEVVLPN